MTTEHTPLPWRLGYSPLNVEWASDRIVCSMAGASAARETDFIAEQHANAALIVRAVNSHHELVEALEGMMRAYDEFNFDTFDPNAARAALAKAKGETS